MTSSPRRDGDEIAALLLAAHEGSEEAWALLVDEFHGLVWRVARGFQLGAATTDDVVQTVWLRLAESTGRIREPARLAGWLATTTRNEALKTTRYVNRVSPVTELPEPSDGIEVSDALLASESQREVMAAFRQLDRDSQQLLSWLCADPPLDYRTISELSGRPIGSIGPTRQRCLKKLRRILTTHTASASGGVDDDR